MYEYNPNLIKNGFGNKETDVDNWCDNHRSVKEHMEVIENSIDELLLTKMRFEEAIDGSPRAAIVMYGYECYNPVVIKLGDVITTKYGHVGVIIDLDMENEKFTIGTQRGAAVTYPFHRYSSHCRYAEERKPYSL